MYLAIIISTYYINNSIFTISDYKPQNSFKIKHDFIWFDLIKRKIIFLNNIVQMFATPWKQTLSLSWKLDEYIYSGKDCIFYQKDYIKSSLPMLWNFINSSDILGRHLIFLEETRYNFFFLCENEAGSLRLSLWKRYLHGISKFYKWIDIM